MKIYHKKVFYFYLISSWVLFIGSLWLLISKDFIGTKKFKSIARLTSPEVARYTIYIILVIGCLLFLFSSYKMTLFILRNKPTLEVLEDGLSINTISLKYNYISFKEIDSLTISKDGKYLLISIKNPQKYFIGNPFEIFFIKGCYKTYGTPIFIVSFLLDRNLELLCNEVNKKITEK